MLRSCFAATIVALSVLAVAPSAMASPAGFTVVASPDASPGNNTLAGVASVSASDVWSVGSADDANGNQQPLTEHWNGAGWSLVPNPSTPGVLNGVAATNSRAVWAVGQSPSGALIEQWNGRTWKATANRAAGPATTLQGVAALSSSDVWAVGTDTSTGAAQTFIEHFNGHKWTVVPSPDASSTNNLLSAVAVVSANDVWAVGDFQNASNAFQTLVEHWDGTAWRIVASPSGAGVQAGLLSVAAVSSTDVWATGNSGSATLIEHWDGTAWTVVPSPTPPGTLDNPLAGVAIVSAHDIWAVGNSEDGTTGSPSTLTEHWDGTSWSIIASPSPGSQAGLSGVAADRSSGQTWAVGTSMEPAPSGVQRTLTEFSP
jgi:hypothetical protein